MPVTSTSYEAQVSAALVAMLAGSATFRALVGAADSTAARAFIVEDFGGEELRAVDGSTINTAGSWATVRLLKTRRVERALYTFGHEGDALVAIHCAAVANDTPAEAMRRARNAQGTIAADMTALLGTVGALLFALFDPDEVILTSATGAEAGVHFCPIAASWRDVP